MNNHRIAAVSTGLILTIAIVFTVGVQNLESDSTGFTKFESDEEFKASIGDSSFNSLAGGVGGAVERTTSDLAAQSSGSSGSYQVERSSDTNIQVSGVGEPDILKNTGDKIYFSPERSYYYRSKAPNTSVFNTLPAENFSEIDKIPANGRMFVTNESIISLGENISAFSRETHEKQWQEELNSSIESARKINDSIYLVLRKNVRNNNPCPVRPLGSTILPCTSFYHPDSGEIDTTYTLVEMDAESGEIIETNGFTGSSSNTVTYVSQDSIYFTYSEQVSDTEIMLEFLNSEGSEYLNQETMNRIEELQSYDISDQSIRNEIQKSIEDYMASLSSKERKRARQELQNGIGNYTDERKRELVTTKIASFNMDLELEAEGEVPGEVNDQFSLDQSSEGLRIATTVGNSWNFDVKPENDLYTLDNDLEIQGSVKGMGLNEQIYSVRYIEDKAYIVTFRRVDPFHVVDISNHQSPELKGELKLPGFSSYLHPLQENRVLGIGEEDGKVKAVIFDVENDNPEVLDSLVLEDYYSEVSSSHHAFQIDRENKVFFLPGSEGGHFFNYENGLEQVKEVKMRDVRRGAFVNQNFYVFNNYNASVIDMENWNTIKEIQFRNESKPEHIPLPEPRVVE